jgi:hypothetical protein
MSNLMWLASAVVILVSFGAAGCADSTVCEDAVDKLVGECEMGAGAALEGQIGECVDETECIARCVNKSSCSAITTPAAKGGKYNECVAACATVPTP